MAFLRILFSRQLIPKRTLMKIGLIMSMKTKLLAIVGSHRKNGNCYALAKSILDSTSSKFRIIQLASKKIEFCVLCEKCVHEDCVLTDDLNQILAEMKKADAIMFIFPKYLLASSKFLAFLERLDTIVHMRKHKGYKHTFTEPNYRLLPKQQPFCVFALSGTGRFKRETLRTVVEYIESLGLTLVSHDRPPFIAVNVRAGDEKGEVLKNKAALKQCTELTKKVIKSIKKN
jgi:multimeric flavodoxin WrbA